MDERLSGEIMERAFKKCIFNREDVTKIILLISTEYDSDFMLVLLVAKLKDDKFGALKFTCYPRSSGATDQFSEIFASSEEVYNAVIICLSPKLKLKFNSIINSMP